MFVNGVNCDIYIGKGAGKKLLRDINNAKKSVKIVSPYLSPFLIKELIKLRVRNLEVELITTDDIEDYNGKYGKNIHQLIIQNKETDKIAVKKREKWRSVVRVVLYLGISLLATLLGAFYYLKEPKLGFGLIPVAVLFLVYKLYKTKIKNKRIYLYWYSQLFPFKVYMSPYKNKLSDTFVHSKIYLIDDRIAYLGSLNFTSSGTKHNYETRIRTEDVNAIVEIKQEIYRLFNNARLPEKNIQNWGRELYSEPIN